MGTAGGGETWLHSETGLAAISMVIRGGEGNGAMVYLLALSLPGGERCNAALVMLALADFDLLEAIEDRVPEGTGRVFRLPATWGFGQHELDLGRDGES